MDSRKERMLDLLAEEVLFGLEENERAELSELEKIFPELNNEYSLELTASALSLGSLELEKLPEGLQKRILTKADIFFSHEKSTNVLQFQPQAERKISEEPESGQQKTFRFAPSRSLTPWLGWAVAGIACLALGISIWTNLQKPKEIYVTREVVPEPLSITKQYDNLLASAKDLKRSTWINPADKKEILGEVVWSETEQKGFMIFRGLPVNDSSHEDYQLWIFDETQNEKTPIDGGTFDIPNSGEVMIPINPRLKFKNPKLFAVTKEKEGGVVVSERKKIAAMAKVST